jgi:Protein of unknown function DUF262
MVSNNSINIAPHYQRRDRWSLEKQSALIESFLINVPVPPIYLSEDDYGTYTVIDGKQRITAINDFLTGKLKLKDMKEIPEVNGQTFSELPVQLRNVLTVRPFIRVITLLKQSNPELKYEVFLRLNTGGEKLKAQEIRNVAYSGPLNDLLFELSGNQFLKQQMKIFNEKSIAYRNMDDLELVLRFLTMKDRWEKFGKKISTAMDLFMAENRNSDVNKYRIQFNSAIDICERIWGEHAFQKPISSGWQNQLIAPLFDAQMVAVSLLGRGKVAYLVSNQLAVLDRTRNLYENDKAFSKSVSQATGDSLAIRNRVAKMLEMLDSVEG